MARELGDMVVRIKGDSSEFDKTVDKSEKKLNSFGSSAEDVGKVLTVGKFAAGATAAILAFQKIKAEVDKVEAAWAAQAEASAILGNVLKTTGANAWTTQEALEGVASQLQKTTKYADENIIAMQGVLLGFRNITGKEFDQATKAVLDMATVMKMDLTSAAQAVGKALDNPAQGLDSLSRQGFKFTEQEKEMMKAMTEAGNIAGAQKIILDELAKTYGGAAEKAGDLEVSLKTKLKNAVGELDEEMGRSASQTLAPFRQWLIDIALAAAGAAQKANDLRDAIKNVRAGTATIDQALLFEENVLKNLKEVRESSKYDPMVSKEELADLDAAIASQQAKIDALKAQTKAQSDLAKATSEAGKKQAESDKKTADAQAAQAKIDAERTKIKVAYNNELKNITRQESIGLLSSEEASKKRTEALANEISSLNDLIDTEGLRYGATIDLRNAEEKRLANILKTNAAEADFSLTSQEQTKIAGQHLEVIKAINQQTVAAGIAMQETARETQAVVEGVVDTGAAAQEAIDSAIGLSEDLQNQATLTANTEIAEQARIDQAIKTTVANNEAAQQEIVDTAIGAARERATQEELVKNLALVAEESVTQGTAKEVVSRNALLDEEAQNAISLSETLQNQATLTANAEIAEQARIEQAVKVSTTNQEGYVAEVVDVTVNGARDKAKAEEEAAKRAQDADNARWLAAARGYVEVTKKAKEFQANQIKIYSNLALRGIDGVSQIGDAFANMFTETGEFSEEFITKFTDGLADIISMIDPTTGAVLKAINEVSTAMEDAVREFNQWITGDDEAIAENMAAAAENLRELNIDRINSTLDAQLDAIDAAEQAELERLHYIDDIGNDLIRSRYDAEIDRIDDAELAELTSRGLLEETESERLTRRADRIRTQIATETSARRRAILEEQLADIESQRQRADVRARYDQQRENAADERARQEADRQRIQDEAERQRRAAEAEAQVQLRVYNRAKAASDKAVALAKAKAEHQSARAELGWFNWNKKAQLDAIYEEIFSAISAIPLPALATGGIAMPQNGGQVVNVAEAGVPEAIIPLDRLDETLESIGERIGEGGGMTRLIVNIDSRPILDQIFPATRDGTVLISARAVVGGR